MKITCLSLYPLVAIWLSAGCEQAELSKAIQGDEGLAGQPTEVINTVLLHAVDDASGERVKSIDVSSGISPKSSKAHPSLASHVRVSPDEEILAVWIDSPQGGTSVVISAPEYEDVELRPEPPDIAKVGYCRIDAGWSGESRELRMKRSEQVGAPNPATRRESELDAE